MDTEYAARQCARTAQESYRALPLLRVAARALAP